MPKPSEYKAARDSRDARLDRQDRDRDMGITRSPSGCSGVPIRPTFTHIPMTFSNGMWVKK